MSDQKEDFIVNLLKEEISISINKGFASKNAVIKFQAKQIVDLEFQLKASEMYFSNFVKQVNNFLDKPYTDALSLKREIRNVIQASTNRAKSSPPTASTNQIYSDPTVPATITVAKNKIQFISDRDTPYKDLTSEKQNLGKFIHNSNEPISLSQILL